MELTISIIGASVAVLVSLIGAWLSNYNTIRLQTRKLKEQHYIDFVTALHNMVPNDKTDDVQIVYVKARDILFTVASPEVINNLLEYEKNGMNHPLEQHNKYLTELMKAIRKDLKIKNNNFPVISFQALLK